MCIKIFLKFKKIAIKIAWFPKLRLKMNGFALYSQILKPPASLLTTLEEMNTLSSKMFFNSLSCHANKMLEKVSFIALIYSKLQKYQ